ncbi:hypothetical protein ACIQUW_33335 [Streptomyces sp. NPDC101117]|uniref:hypothetical protein n=1 Tax=Streptomyces sp. NPDC101117 TaxID=3366108 RepID=UPI00381EFAAA
MTSSTGWGALEKRLNSVKKPVRTFALCDDPGIRDRYLAAKREAEEADAALAALTPDADPGIRTVTEQHAKTARAELTAAKKAYDAHTVTLRFQALERRELEELLAKHPPTEQDEENGSEFTETFMPALISAASLDGMPEEAAARFMQTWTPADARALWQAAWQVQHTQRADLGKG